METLLEKRQLQSQNTTIGIRLRLAINFSILAILAMGVIVTVLYLNFRQQVRNDLSTRLRNIAAVAALQQNGDEFAQIDSPDHPLYEKFRQQNLKIRQSDPEIGYVFTLRKDENGVYFVVDAGEPGEVNIAPYGESYAQPSEFLLENFDTMTQAISNPEIVTDEYGSFLDAYAPIFDSKGQRVGVLGIDMDANEVTQKENRFVLISMVTFILTSLAAALTGWLLGNNLSRPITELTKNANRIAAGDLNQRVAVNTNIAEIKELALDFNIMTNSMRDMVRALESRVVERTASLSQRTDELENASRKNERRATQLRAVAQVARAISSVQNMDDLLPSIAAVVGREFKIYHVGIFLLDEQNEYAALTASNSEGGQRMLKHGHKLKVGQVGIVGYSAATGQARIALDTGEDAIFFDNPDLPNTHSEMAIPLRVGKEVIGVLDVQSEATEAFDEEDIELLTIVADQVSIAIQNARQFQAARIAADEAEEVYRRYLRNEWRSLIREQKRLGYRYSKAGVGPLKSLSHTTETMQAIYSGKTNTTQKGTQAQMAVPIKLRGEVIGILNIASERQLEWDQDDIDICEAIAERVALALENVRLLESSQAMASRERTIGEATSRIGASVNMRSVLQTAVEELGRIIPGAEVVIQLGAENEDYGSRS